MKLRFLAIILLLSYSAIQSQDFALFVDRTSLFENQEMNGPIARVFTDVNGDYRDDIVRVNDGNKLYLEVQSDNGKAFAQRFIGQFEGDSWTLGVADLNNDGINEIMSSGSYNGAFFYSPTDKQSNYIESYKTEDDFFAQASNFVDMNNDGLTDLFVCNDDGLSKMFFNQGDGVYDHDPEFIDMTTESFSDNSGNYGSEWTDVDDDGDLDLYIAKCRFGATSFTDPRRLNALFINDGGTFTEQAEAFGIALGAQTWTANFGDIDNDGDQDLFMINHDYRYTLYENINNTEFVEIPLLEDGTEILDFGLQSAFEDMNNDGYLDIVIGGERSFLLINNKEKAFTNNENPSPFGDMNSFALGDANEDGFIDVFAGYNDFSGRNTANDKLWINITNPNNYAAFSLKGTSSNRNGIGAKVMIYGEWGKQTRIIKSGLAYGITNSMTARFGIDDYESIDSLVIHWPSGIKETHVDPNINTHYVVEEGGCMNPVINISADGERIDCATEEINISLNTSGSESILWNTDETNASITVDMPGDYNLIATDEDNCTLYAQTISIFGPERLDISTLNINKDVTLCKGEELLLLSYDSNEYLWNTGDVDNDLTVNTTGLYYFVNQNQCDTLYSDSIYVNFVDPRSISENRLDTIETAGSLELDSGDPTTRWYSDANATDLLNEGQTLQTDVIDRDTTFYFEMDAPLVAPQYIGGALVEEFSNNFTNFNAFSPKLIFQVDQPIVFKSFSTISFAEAERLIYIEDNNTEERIWESLINITDGTVRIPLDLTLEPGTYAMSTDQTVNLENLGTAGPQLAIQLAGIFYPYEISDLMTIEASTLGGGTYNYFFNWEIEPVLESCTSPLYEYNIVYDPLSSLTTIGTSEVQFYPIPAHDVININAELDLDQLIIYDINGRTIKNEILKSSNPRIDISDIDPGTYYFEVYSNNAKALQKVIIVR